MALTTRISINMLGTLTNVLDVGATATVPIPFEHSFSWASGVGASQADMIWADQRTLTASATEALDLVATLTHLLTGAAMTFARIKAVFIFAAAANTNSVQVTRTATTGSNLFMADGDGIELAPGDFFCWGGSGAIGKVVATGDTDTITITNSAGGTSVIYDIVIIGASA